MFKGSFTALVTPFKDGKVDDASFQRLVEWQIAEGTNGLVPVGTTGESPTLSHDEHKHVVELCIKTARKRVPVIAGAGSNSTAEAIDFTLHAKKAGADATLHSTGYYNKPTQDGLYRHFKAISDAVDLPLFLYNVPIRTIVDISVATMARCAKLKNVVGVKDATANVARVTQQRLACGMDFIQLSGEDATVLGFMAHGGHGCISVTANVVPRLCALFHKACLEADFAAALELQDKLMPLHDALFVETNPAPAKYAAWRLGIIESPECRLPLAPITDATKKVVDEALAHVGALKAKAAQVAAE
jgi:4-hydroxy-tetrahydrodipicolinate synthase